MISLKGKYVLLLKTKLGILISATLFLYALVMFDYFLIGSSTIAGEASVKKWQNPQAWELDWYYFGDIVTLLHDQDDHRANLIEEMRETEKTDLCGLLRGDGSTPNESALFRFIRNLPKIANRNLFKWKQASKVGVQLASMPDNLKNQSLLTPNEVYLPWPFPVPNGDAVKAIVDDCFSAH